MTVAELIELLEKQDPAAEVVVDGDPGTVRHMGRSACR